MIPIYLLLQSNLDICLHYVIENFRIFFRSAVFERDIKMSSFFAIFKYLKSFQVNSSAGDKKGI